MSKKAIQFLLSNPYHDKNQIDDDSDDCCTYNSINNSINKKIVKECIFCGGVGVCFGCFQNDQYETTYFYEGTGELAFTPNNNSSIQKYSWSKSISPLN